MRNLVCCFFTICALPATLSAQPLQLLPENRHYFSFAGKPLAIVGSGEHYGAVMNLDFDYTRYLETLKKDGLNHTRLFTGAYYEKPGAFGIERNTMAPAEDKLILPWKRSGDKYDLEAWNEDFFARLRDFMEKAGRFNVLVEVTLFSAYYGAGWAYHPFNGANNVNGTPAGLAAHLANSLENGSILRYQEAYVRKLVRELNGFDHFYFEIQNEPWAEGNENVLTWYDYLSRDELKNPGNGWKTSLEVPSDRSRSWHKAVSSWIVSEEKGLPKKHLISHNIANFKQPAFVSDPYISIYNFHYALPEAVGMNYRIGKVVGCNETGFAGKSDDTYRRQAWRFMMAGGGLFSHLDYSFSAGREDGTDVENNAPGGGSPALRRQFRVLKDFLNGLDLATLKADDVFLGHVEGAFAYAMQDAKNRVVYLEPLLARPVEVNLVLPKGKYRVEWLDVLTGNTLKTEEIRVKTPGTRLESPAGGGEMVLVVGKGQGR